MDRTELLMVLTHAVPFLTLEQMSWINRGPCDPRRREAARLSRLQSEGLVNVSTPMLQRIHPREPIFNWKPGFDEPDFDALAYQNQRRWWGPLVKTYIFSATSKAADLTGGPLPKKRSLRDTDLSHDAALGWVYLLHYHGKPSFHWCHEDSISASNLGYGSKVPDALVNCPNGILAVELVGRSYSATRLFEIHRAYSHAPYALW